MSLPQRGSGRLSPRNTVRTMRAAWLRLQRSWRPVRDMDPEFWRKLGAELSSVRPWIDRGIVLAYAALTGLIVVGFTLLAEAATHGFAALTQASVYAKYISLLWTPALTVVLLWWTRRFVPGAMGSGIPQVVRALDDDLDHAAAEAGWSRCGCPAQDRAWSRAACWPVCRLAEKARRCRSARGHGACPALAVAAIRSGLARPDGGRRCSGHCRRVQHAAGRHHLRAGATVPAAQHVAQLAGDRQHCAGRPGGGVRVRQRDLLRPPAGAGAVLELCWGRACWWRWWRAWRAGCFPG
jgi:hypothetical protein